MGDRNALVEELDDFITHGPITDIYIAEDARAVIRVINVRRTLFERTPFASTFQALQTYALERYLLAINRLYERPDRYPLQSFPAALDLFEKHLHALLPIAKASLLREPLVLLGLWKSELERLDDLALSQEILKRIREKMPTYKMHVALNALKTTRDKLLAHREHIDPDLVPSTTFEECEQLLKFAKLALAAICGGYLSFAYMLNDGSFPLSEDAHRTANAIDYLAEHLAIDASRQDQP